MNSDSFFRNTDCKYFPCHKTEHPEDINCLFCYCPLYMLGSKCGGNFTYTETGIKNCTDCMVPHSRNAVQYIIKRWPDIAAVASKKPEQEDD